MATKLKQEAAKSVKRWCDARNIKLTKPVRHIHPMSYVVGYSAPKCLIVAVPWIESEPQIKDFDRENPLKTINRFDASLLPGDWCITAYICTDYRNETIAIEIPHFVEKKRAKNET